MDVRYQVFISSTFADLKNERGAVFQTLMEMDCIPAGMELFPAMDEEQWNFIKRIIDDCDYYILIIGGRYGSISSAGISYTEMEYDYAITRGLKVMAFVHENPENIPAKFTDGDASIKLKLDAFRTKVTTGRLVKFWNEGKELPGLVSLSLNKTIRTYPAIGWVRADKVASETAVQEQNKLLREVEALKQALADERAQRVNDRDDLASLNDEFTVKIKWTERSSRSQWPKSLNVTVSWSEIFKRLGPDVEGHPSDGAAKLLLGASLLRLSQPGHRYTVNVDDEHFKIIRIQLRALGLVSVDYNATTKGGHALFWSLTKAGHAVLTRLLTVKRNAQQAIPDTPLIPSQPAPASE